MESQIQEEAENEQIDLTSDTIYQFAISHYKNIEICDFTIFSYDYRQVCNLNKYFYNYECKDVLKKRKIQNIIISFYNTFYELDDADRIIFFLIKNTYHFFLKTFIESYYNRTLTTIYFNKNKSVYIDKLELDEVFIKKHFF